MSSGAHLSKELHDLIKSIGETRSKQEEDKIILAEQQRLKEKISEPNISTRKQKENLIKAIYIEMLGHDASFSHIQAVNMTQCKQLSLKRLGYLCCCLFLQDESELLILLVANFQRDLQSSSIHEVVIALTALAKLINNTIVTALVDQVNKLLTHTTDLVRKKAVSVLQKIYRLSPSYVPDYEEKMRRSLCDKEPSVMGATLNLYYEQIKINPNAFKETTSSFVLILKQVIEHKLPRDFDYHRIPAPWIQIKLLQLLAMLGANDLKVSEQIYEILGMALKRSDDTGINIGHAVTYQCVKTVASIYPNQNLLEMAASSVSKFLTSENNNLKYLGINALIQIVSVDPKYVVEHQLTVVDCLESKDETLKRETLELLYKMTNSNNIISIVDKLVFFIKSTTDPHFKKDLVNKITQLSERFAPNQEWFLKTMNIVFEYGAEYVNDEILNNFLRLLNENFGQEGPDFGVYIIDTYLQTIVKPNLSDIMVKMVSWVIGEIGSIIYENNQEKLNKLVEALLQCVTNEFEDSSARSWVLSALAKLSSCPQFQMQDELAACFEYYQKSKYLDVQQRSSDFKYLAKYNAALRKSNLVNFDENLAFLNNFVQQARLKGGKDYDKNRCLKQALNNQGESSENKPGNLYFDPKSQNSLSYHKQPGKDEDVQIKVKGDSKWTSEGYKDPIESKPITVIKDNKQGISYNDFKTGISSANNPAGIPVYTSDKPKPKIDEPSKPIAVKKEVEDPRKQEKQKEMKALFEGVSGMNTGVQPTKPVSQSQQQTNTASTGIKIQNTSNGNWGPSMVPNTGQITVPNTVQQVQKKPQPLNQQQPVIPVKTTLQPSNNEINLLDMDDIFPSTNQSQQSTQQSQPQVQQIPQKQPQTQGLTPFQMIQQQQQAMQQQKQQPFFQQLQPSFTPLQISVSEYEKYWKELQIEKNQQFQSRIKSEEDFKKMLNNLQIHLIEIMDNEMICASKNNRSGAVMLFYGIHNTDGKLDITLKSNSKEDIDYIFSSVKQRFC